MVSIIIPTFNRAQQLKKTLQSLLDLNLSKLDYEVLVIDNGSTDETESVCLFFINRVEEFNLRYIYDAEPGLLTGRHRGAAESLGEILTFIDDDIIVSSTWLKTIIQVMDSNKGVDLLTGPCLPMYERYPPDWINYFWKYDENKKYLFPLSLLDFGAEPQNIHPNFVWGLNFTIRKSCFLELGGFNPDSMPPDLLQFVGDGETGLTAKAFEKNKIAYYHPDVLVYHVVPQSRLTIDYFKKRYFFQGVANSFTKFRKLSTNHKISVENNFKIKLYAFLSTFCSIGNNKQNNNIYNRIKNEEKEGYLFHRTHYRKSSKVRDWVHKNDYLEYKLPRNG
jgi:glycosyltransferase involved in cell wall biosynthesis